jgi:hypothetical protein
MSTCRLLLPSTFWTVRGTPSFTNQVLAGASHKIAFAFIAQDSTTINALGLRLNAVAGITPTYTIEIQGLDGSGLPDGTPLGGSSATFNPTSLGWTTGSFNWISIPGAAISRGAPYAIVVRYASGTIDVANSATFSLAQSNIAPDSIALPYHLTDTGAGYVKSNAICDLAFGYRSNTQTYGTPVQGWISGALTTNGHRATLKLALDSGWGSTYKVRGLLNHAMQSGSSGGLLKFGIWDTAGNEVASTTVDSDHSGNNALRQHRGFFSSVPTLSFGTTYHFGIERVAGTNPLPRYVEVAANRDLEAYPFGPSAVLSIWDGSAWTDINNQILPITLFLDDWTKPTASGQTVSIIMG